MEYLDMSLPTHISNVDNIHTLLLSQFFTVCKKVFSVDQLGLYMTVEVLCSSIKGTKHFHANTIRYDTRCYFNVRSKADISQLNLPHGNDN